MFQLLKAFIRKGCRKIGLYDPPPPRAVLVQRHDVVQGEALLGKTVLITGGTSGIGLAIARKCLACGATVLVTGRNAEKLAGAQAKLPSNRFLTMQWDVTDFQGMTENLAHAIRLVGGRLDILVNNAGISIRQSPLELTIDAWDRVLETDLKAPVFLSREMANIWLQSNQGGVILNVSSMAGLEPAFDAYSAAKCALNSITRGFARQWARAGIRVNAIAPGLVVGTDLRDFQRQTDPYGDVHCDWIPLGRCGVPDEIAELAVFMMGNTGSYMTGSVVACDGAGSLR